MGAILEVEKLEALQKEQADLAPKITAEEKRERAVAHFAKAAPKPAIGT